MPPLSMVAVASSYARPALIAAAAALPKLLKGIMAADGIRQKAIRETAMAVDTSIEETSKRPDVLTQLLAIVRAKGKTVNFIHKEVISEMWTRVYVRCICEWADLPTCRSMPGAVSTSIRPPRRLLLSYEEPREASESANEVDAVFENGTLSYPVKYNQAIALPCLTAVVKEATRLFPSSQATMPCYTPIHGIGLCGKYIPAGY